MIPVWEVLIQIIDQLFNSMLFLSVFSVLRSLTSQIGLSRFEIREGAQGLKALDLKSFIQDFKIWKKSSKKQRLVPQSMGILVLVGIVSILALLQAPLFLKDQIWRGHYDVFKLILTCLILAYLELSVFKIYGDGESRLQAGRVLMKLILGLPTLLLLMMSIFKEIGSLSWKKMVELQLGSFPHWYALSSPSGFLSSVVLLVFVLQFYRPQLNRVSIVSMREPPLLALALAWVSSLQEILFLLLLITVFWGGAFTWNMEWLPVSYRAWVVALMTQGVLLLKMLLLSNGISWFNRFMAQAQWESLLEKTIFRLIPLSFVALFLGFAQDWLSKRGFN